jgi:hypothetical protein
VARSSVAAATNPGTSATASGRSVTCWPTRVGEGSQAIGRHYEPRIGDPLA